MDRGKIVQDVIAYFKGDQWRRMAAALEQDPEPRGTHAHIFVETCVHPNNIEELICGFFAQRGAPSARRIDYMAPRPGEMGSLHGVEPKGQPHFDFNFFYNPNVALAGSEGGAHGESGCNLCIWNRRYINAFYADFPFRQVGEAEEEKIRQYFRSEHWHRGVEMSILPDTNHQHINAYTSVHPEVLRRFAEESLAAKGWEIYYTCPNVYLVNGRYTGKLVFMGKNPEAVYDLGWMFKPDVVLEPALDDWVFKNGKGYDTWTTPMREPVMAQPYVRLTDGEVARALEAIKP